MKKVFAFLLAMCAVTAVFAQRGYERGRSRDVILGQGNRSVYHDRNDGYLSARERDEKIARIQREYYWRIESVRKDRDMRNGEKRRQIRFLENERDRQIRKLWDRFNRQHQKNGRRY